SGCGDRSNTKRSTYALTTVSARHAPLWPVTSSSIIRSGRIQVLTRGRRSVFTTIICRKSRQHDFAAVAGGITPVGLRLLRDTPATAQDQPNRQRLHLAEPKRCLDEAGHLWPPRSPPISVTWKEWVNGSSGPTCASSAPNTSMAA